MAPIYFQPMDIAYFFLKKFDCPKCSGRMRAVWTYDLYDENDPALDIDLKRELFDGYTRGGDVAIKYWLKYKCKTCGLTLKENEIHDYERRNRTADQ